mgnify:FL=1
MEGDLLCSGCLAGLPDVPERCYRCHRASIQGQTCTDCLRTSYLLNVQVGTNYEGYAKDLIWRLKLAGAQAAASVMASRLAPLLVSRSKSLQPNTHPLLIVPLPTATSRVRQRGYDQARLLARELSRQTGIHGLGLLARSGQAHQHGLSRQQRLTQMEQVFRVTRPQLVSEASIILVDDVVTTGASLEAAARALHQAGAAHISAVVFARPKTPH